ncbi:SDR family oxidoreductase [Aspergillus vadensis CBS 113365]|uniref:Integral membrane protein n=1 Tax=Aspergillus vadensis (strain CBS 113365 / IMI 142717 / IBT 24658) TaxID=1448311 RepID=A0A319B053_ASPVC|nr:integral membrane protein [Aspergillus vadensis CBS 113365]PYH66016.1 integral membrane protein [Aspergillus vadensis CBS 113365]
MTILDIPPKEASVWPVTLGILSWVFWSNLTILFNKWVIESTEFRYPIILTTWHLVFATLATQLLARTTTMLDGRKRMRMDGRTYVRMIIPIGILYSGSLVCSNIVYLYLNVSFIQMLKACGPIVTLLTSWAWHVKTPSLESFLNILLIAFSVALAVAGEVQFSWLGVIYQLASLVFDANRLVMIQILLSDEGQKMDPLVTLYYSAPVCAFTNFMIAFYTELRGFSWSVVGETGFGVLLANAAVGFMLNVSIFVLIGKTSGLTMTLVSVPKNILLIVCSVVIWGTQITSLQMVGYAIALLGLLYYSLGWATIRGAYDAGYVRLVGRQVERVEKEEDLGAAPSERSPGSGSRMSRGWDRNCTDQRGRLYDLVNKLTMDQLNDISGRLALITGASGGIGAACARQLAAKAVHLALTYSSNPTSITTLQKELQNEHPALVITIHQVDVSSPTQITTLFTEIQSQHNNRTPDILISNAGYGKRVPQVWDITTEEFDYTLTVNLRASFLLVKGVVEHMKTQRWGRIIFMSSIAGYGGGINGCHYAASKAGLTGMMKNLATRLAEYNISVNDVAPAMIGDTGMIPNAESIPEVASTIPLGRLGLPEEVANVVTMLVKTGYMTGQSLLLAGGLK